MVLIKHPWTSQAGNRGSTPLASKWFIGLGLTCPIFFERAVEDFALAVRLSDTPYSPFPCSLSSRTCRLLCGVRINKRLFRKRKSELFSNNLATNNFCAIRSLSPGSPAPFLFFSSRLSERQIGDCAKQSDDQTPPGERSRPSTCTRRTN